MDSRREELLPTDNRAAHRRVLAIALPAILANSSAPLIGLVDTWAIGHLPGSVHLAAVGLGGVIFTFVFWAFGFLRMGTTGLVAQAHGRADQSELERTVVRSCVLALLMGALLLLAQAPLLDAALAFMVPPEAVAEMTRDYYDIRIWAAPATLLVYSLTGVLFGLGRTGPVLYLQLFLNLLNGALNLLFVIGLDLGVAGVAWGTLIAQWLAALLGLWLVLRCPECKALGARLRDARCWQAASYRPLLVLNGFIFLRTVLLMTALSIIMREAAGYGETGMAVTHVLNQYLLLISLGLDGFAHAAEAQTGAAWGDARLQTFRRWVRLTGVWALLTSLLYALGFWFGGNAITALLTDLTDVRSGAADLMPLVAVLPLVAVWCYHFDGVYIGATAARAMFGTMLVAFLVYLLVLTPLQERWGLAGLWSALLVFMAARGLAQALWYPRLLRQLAQKTPEHSPAS